MPQEFEELATIRFDSHWFQSCKTYRCLVGNGGMIFDILQSLLSIIQFHDSLLSASNKTTGFVLTQRLQICWEGLFSSHWPLISAQMEDIHQDVMWTISHTKATVDTSCTYMPVLDILYFSTFYNTKIKNMYI